MPTAQDYLLKLADLMGQPVNDNALQVTLSGDWKTAEAARQLIEEYGLKQKELRLLKREVHMTMEVISKAYVSQRIAVGKTVGWGVARGLFGRNRAGMFSMAKRNGITMEKDAVLKPHRELIMSIDNLVLAFDRQKAKVEAALLDNHTDKSLKETLHNEPQGRV
jgi:hypothetical protein